MLTGSADFVVLDDEDDEDDDDDDHRDEELPPLLLERHSPWVAFGLFGSAGRQLCQLLSAMSPIAEAPIAPIAIAAERLRVGGGEGAGCGIRAGLAKTCPLFLSRFPLLMT